MSKLPYKEKIFVNEIFDKQIEPTEYFRKGQREADAWLQRHPNIEIHKTIRYRTEGFAYLLVQYNIKDTIRKYEI